MRPLRRRTFLLALAASLLFASGCPRPDALSRPRMGSHPVTVVPPTPRDEQRDEAQPDLSHPNQIRRILAEAEGPVRIRVFAHPIDDPTSNELVRVSREILKLAPGRTRFDLTDPLETNATSREARILGVEPLGSLPRRRPRRSPLPTDAEYRALIVAMGEDYLVVPQVTHDLGDAEFQVAEAFSRLMHGPRLVGLVASEEERERLRKLHAVMNRLDVRPLSLDDPIPEEFSAVVIVGPGERLRRPQVDTLRRFVAKGRAAALLIHGMEVERRAKRLRVRRARSGLSPLLADFGVSVERGLIFDNRCGRVSVPARVGRMLLPYPPIPTVRLEAPEITPDARTLRLPYPSALRVRERDDVEVSVILESSPESWVERGGYDLSPYRDWEPVEEDGPHTFGALLTKRDNPETKLAVIANARFVEDEYLEVADNAVFVRQLVEHLGGHRALSRLIERRSRQE